MINQRPTLFLVAIIVAAVIAAPVRSAAPPSYPTSPQVGADEADSSLLLVTRDFQLRPIRLAAINDQSLVMMESDRGWVTLDIKQCIALLNPQADRGSRSARGLLMLADGQRLPGEAITNAAAITPDTLAWNHPWLGRVDVPFRLISAVLLTPDAIAPVPGNADVVMTVNGDKQEGFVTAIGDPVTIEVVPAAGVAAPATPQTINIPLDRVTAISMIAPRQAGTGRRMWFAEGTVLDVQTIAVGEDGYVRMGGGSLLGAASAASASSDSRGRATQPPRIGMADISAMLFDRDALMPLSLVPPARVEGPATRYVLPRPALLDPDASLGLSTIEYSGPLVVRYALPAGCQRFIADAELPRTMRAWGDCELIVRSDDHEVFRGRLNAQTPTAAVNVPLRGSELTIEIAPGAHGPIQDLVRLHRPMLLKGK